MNSHVMRGFVLEFEKDAGLKDIYEKGRKGLRWLNTPIVSKKQYKKFVKKMDAQKKDFGVPYYPKDRKLIDKVYSANVSLAEKAPKMLTKFKRYEAPIVAKLLATPIPGLTEAYIATRSIPGNIAKGVKTINERRPSKIKNLADRIMAGKQLTKKEIGRQKNHLHSIRPQMV